MNKILIGLTLLVIQILMGCNYRDQLKQIEANKKICKEFKLEVDRVGVPSPTGSIKDKIEECQSLGAW